MIFCGGYIDDHQGYLPRNLAKLGRLGLGTRVVLYTKPFGTLCQIEMI